MLAALLLAALATPANAGVTPLAGVEWTPLSRGDLTWVDDDRTTGVAVGELDGLVRPAMTGFGGVWIGERVGLVAGLGVARLQSTSWVGDVYVARHWGVVRPSMDLRVGILKRELRRPVPWVMLGFHGDIPSSRDVSNGYSEEEQVAADETSYEDRLRLGGLGGRVGAGVDYRLVDGVAIGALYAVEAHWGVLRTSETEVVSSWVSSHASLLLTFEWGPRDGG
jgi:hypothetical protein